MKKEKQECLMAEDNRIITGGVLIGLGIGFTTGNVLGALFFGLGISYLYLGLAAKNASKDA
ncbi:hypothetical protein CL645_03550 [bacterium]|nr:hypothetical protein [bacterium]|tara:strand:- start:263 stop:445 length:183 start_codon:yes stop_codon:yes gene_type:complete